MYLLPYLPPPYCASACRASPAARPIRQRGPQQGTPGRASRPLHQLAGVREVRGGDVERARRREHDQPGAIPERADLHDEPLLDEERERVKPHPEGTARGRVQMASIARREDIDLRRAQLDRVRDRRVVRHAAVDQLRVAPPDGREDGGNCGAGEDRLDDITLGKPSLATALQIHADHMKRNRGILEPFELDMTLEQTAEAGAREKRASDAEEAEQARHKVQREYLVAVDLSPHLTEGISGGDGRRPRRDEGSVHRADRGRYDQVRRNALLVERVKHPDLYRAEAGAA